MSALFRWRSVALALAHGALVAGAGHAPLEAQTQERDVLGTRVQVQLRQAAELRGELLAVDARELWVLDSGRGVTRAPFDEVARVLIPRHDWSGARIGRWALIAGGGTASALLVACANYEGSSGCGGVIAASVLAWGAVTGLAALFILPTRNLESSDPEVIRPYARFPQGMPDGFLPATVSADSSVASGARVPDAPEPPPF